MTEHKDIVEEAGRGAEGEITAYLLSSQFEGRSNEQINPVFCDMTPYILVQII